MSADGADARDRLRQYLEQRRELGERELVLDSMSVDDVLRVIGVGRGNAPLKPPRPRPPAPVEADAIATTAPDAAAAASLDDVRPEVSPAEDDEDPGAPADHPRLHAEGTPGAQDTVPPAPSREPEDVDRGQAWGGSPEAAPSGDWRAALRAADADPDTARPQAPDPEPMSDPRSSPTPPYISGALFPGLDVPVGVIATGAGTELFGGPSEGLDSLDQLSAAVRGCTRCQLYKTATNGVPGEGPPDADFVVVGEAPGADEDASGRPFVGASGQLLTKILAAINLRREDVFIVNVVKHRPPGNRNPAPDEVAACSPYLVRQLELIRPKVILTVGNFAAQTLLGTKLGISKLRGQVHLYHGVPLVATYHPAALLRNPTWKRPTWEDVQLARRLLDRATSQG